MKSNLSSFVVGLLFALGLGISGMTSPSKVVGFLDIFGSWDPSLMFVMIGAIGVHATSYFFIKKRSSPLLAGSWHLPSSKEITPSLIIGAILFGVGWGLAGFCPGPAVTSLATLNNRVIIFVVAMIIGMLLFKVFDRFVNAKK